MAYYVVDIIDIVSPVDEGLYEFEDDEYIPSEDVYPDPEKTYYDYEEDEDEEELDEYEEADVEPGDELGEGFYELVGGEYVETSDAVALPGKAYYVYTLDVYEPPVDPDTFYYVADEVGNPAEAGLYEKAGDGSYFLTEDIEYDDEKIYYAQAGSLVKDDIEEAETAPYYSPADIAVDGVREVQEATIASGMNMVYAWTAYVDDPSSKGFYEIVDGAYVLTQDTELVKGKTYYEHFVYNDYYEADMAGVEDPSFSLHKYYELVNGAYALTADTEVNPQKTYYRSHIDDDNFYIPDPVMTARSGGSS